MKKLLPLVFLLAGCGGQVRLPDIPGPKHPPTGVHGGLAPLIASIAYYATGIAAAALIVCAVGFIFTRSIEFLKGIVASLAVCVIGEVLIWFAGYLWLAALITVVVAVAAAAAWLWIHRRTFECDTGVDLDRDGKIG